MKAKTYVRVGMLPRLEWDRKDAANLLRRCRGEWQRNPLVNKMGELIGVAYTGNTQHNVYQLQVVRWPTQGA